MGGSPPKSPVHVRMLTRLFQREELQTVDQLNESTVGKEIFQIAKSLQVGQDSFELVVGGPLFELGLGEKVLAKNGFRNRMGVHVKI